MTNAIIFLVGISFAVQISITYVSEKMFENAHKRNNSFYVALSFQILDQVLNTSDIILI